MKILKFKYKKHLYNSIKIGDIIICNDGGKKYVGIVLKKPLTMFYSKHTFPNWDRQFHHNAKNFLSNIDCYTILRHENTKRNSKRNTSIS